jgi:glycosyltransferase involved in cell wall biosynthesis
MGELLDWRKLMREQGLTAERYAQRLAQEGALTILYIGRMVPGKGFDLLIEAFSRVKEQDRFNVVLVGNGPEEKPLREMVERKGLSRYITFAGYLPKAELYEMLKKTDIFIQPRWRSDMSSLSLLTAVVFGIPCIVPQGGGLAWMAGQGASTFADGDALDLARKIEALREKKATLLEISEGCFERLKDPILDHTNRASLLFDTMRKLTGN